MYLTSVYSKNQFPSFVENLSSLYLCIFYSHIRFTVKMLSIYIYIYFVLKHFPLVRELVEGRNHIVMLESAAADQVVWILPPVLLLAGHEGLFCQPWTLKKNYTHRNGLLSGLNELICVKCFEVIQLRPLIVHIEESGAYSKSLLKVAR